MGYINLPPALQTMFEDLRIRLTKLENAQRFTVPSVTVDPTYPRVGDMWLNTTSNQLKIVGKSGAVTVITTAP